MKKVEIGTSGYVYKHWKKIFYPEELPAGKWFEYYTQHFKTVELNITFYRLPSLEAFKGWYKKSPPAFTFFIKGSRFITHIKRLKDCKEALNVYFKNAAPLKEKMAGVLWQLPPQSKKDAPRLESFLKELNRFPTRHVFEFRHESWFDPEITALLKKAGAIYCRADRRDYYERIVIPDTADFIYIRRHGAPNKRNRYSEKEIEADAAEIRKWMKKKKKVYVYYNNDLYGDALENALRLEELLAEG